VARKTRTPPDVAKSLDQQARDLEKLIEDAKRIHREVTSHLSKIRRAGEPCAPNKNARK